MKFKEIKNISKEEKENKLKELKLELIKAKSISSKTANSKAKDIRKIIARILTLNTEDKIFCATKSNSVPTHRKQQDFVGIQNKLEVENKK